MTLKFKKYHETKEHHLMINRSIPEAYITIINIYASNIGGHQYITQMVPTTIVEIESNTIKEGNFTNSHQCTGHPDRKLIRKHKY